MIDFNSREEHLAAIYKLTPHHNVLVQFFDNELTKARVFAINQFTPHSLGDSTKDDNYLCGRDITKLFKDYSASMRNEKEFEILLARILDEKLISINLHKDFKYIAFTERI